MKKYTSPDPWELAIDAAVRDLTKVPTHGLTKSKAKKILQDLVYAITMGEV